MPRPPYYPVAVTGAWIPFSKPHRAKNELAYVEQVLASGHTHGDGPFTEQATARLLEIVGARAALLTGSGTHALELAAWLLDLGPGDEVIVPSFTFSTTAASIVATGATPVFVDVDPRTASIDVGAVEAAVNPRTRAVSVVHYGGVAPDMDRLAEVAHRTGIAVIEDDAHGLGATWKGRGCGTFGVLAALSFHATKNVQCGEGGALLVNDAALLARAEILREKGTDRSRFLRGEVDKYSWVDRGSSYLLSELSAAVLAAQLEEFDTVQTARHAIWDRYAAALTPWAAAIGGDVMSPPPEAEHPAHVFYVLAPDRAARGDLLDHLRGLGIGATFHYIPLHSSAAGRRFGRTPFGCPVTEDLSARMVRLPLWPDMTDEDVDRVIAGALAFTPARIP